MWQGLSSAAAIEAVPISVKIALKRFFGLRTSVHQVHARKGLCWAEL
jgi:hypothetical protein